MRISDWSSDVCSSDLLAHYPDHRGALDGKGKMTAPRRDIMMAPDQSSIGKCEGKAVRHSASGQVEQAFHIACYLQPAALHRFDPHAHGGLLPRESEEQ